MHLDLHVSRFDWAGGPAGIGPGVADLARTAEEVGVRTLSVMDHFFQMDMVGARRGPDARGLHRARLRRRVSPRRCACACSSPASTYRHPGLLAKTVTTLDVLSGGRAELGIGAAWYEREHHGLGVPFPPTAERFERLEEALQICLQMWSDDNGAVRRASTTSSPRRCARPPPVSAPRPRIMIGGGGEQKTLRLVAQYADACNLFGPPDEVAHKLDVLRRHCDDRRPRHRRDRGHRLAQRR